MKLGDHVFGGKIDLEKAAKDKKVKRPGVRGGQYYITDTGEIRYGARPVAHGKKHGDKRQASLFSAAESAGNKRTLDVPENVKMDKPGRKMDKKKPGKQADLFSEKQPIKRLAEKVEAVPAKAEDKPVTLPADKLYSIENLKTMSFDEFKKLYQDGTKQFMKYAPNQGGSTEWAGRMANFEDANPEWVEKIENEGSAGAAKQPETPKPETPIKDLSEKVGAPAEGVGNSNDWTKNKEQKTKRAYKKLDLLPLEDYYNGALTHPLLFDGLKIRGVNSILRVKQTGKDSYDVYYDFGGERIYLTRDAFESKARDVAQRKAGTALTEIHELGKQYYKLLKTSVRQNKEIDPEIIKKHPYNIGKKPKAAK